MGELEQEGLNHGGAEMERIKQEGLNHKGAEMERIEQERLHHEGATLEESKHEDKGLAYGEFNQEASESEGMKQIEPEQDINALVALLDGYTKAGDSRIKVDVVEGEGEVISRQYHHGRCDVGSPWACGTAFDVLE